MGAGVGGHVRDHAHRRARRADIGATRQVFLDDIVLHRALQFRDIRALFLGHGNVKRQQPGRGGVDRHRGIHLLKRDLIEKRAHVAQMADRHADLADLTLRQFVIAVIAGLRRQVESHRKTCLPLGKVAAVKCV